jgi:hypothetical protein
MTHSAENDAPCTCGPNGTRDECAAELAAGGWCPRPHGSRVIPPVKG